MRQARRVMAVITVLLLIVGAAAAQTGTWNLPSATPLSTEDGQAFGDVRSWEEDNTTWGVFVRANIDENADATVGYFDWDVTGEDPIDDAERASDLSTVVVDLKWLIHAGTPRIAVRTAADFEEGSGAGTNTATGASAFVTGAIPTVSVPIEFGDPQGALLIIEPKVVWFDTQMPATAGPPIEGFGTAMMIGAGVRYPITGTFTVVADAAYPVNDYNSIDDETNEVTEEPVWSAGVSGDLGSGWDVGVFATTAAGPTPATSSIAAPDQSVGFGARVGKSW